MATRSSIKVIVEYGKEERILLCLYKHRDWYPEGTLKRIIEGFIKYKTLWDRDVVGSLHEIFCQWRYFDAMRVIFEENYWQMWEEYLYTIYVWEMWHKRNNKQIRIECLDVHTQKTTSVIIGTGEWDIRKIVSWEKGYLNLIGKEDVDNEDIAF